MLKPVVKTAPLIKEPCPIRWEEMRGDARRRFCDHCQLHVQNLSAMSPRQVAGVLRRSRKEPVCVTYTKRADGSMVTRAELLRERCAMPFRRAFSWLLAAFVPVALGACSTMQTTQPVAGRVTPTHQGSGSSKTASNEQERVIITGGI